MERRRYRRGDVLAASREELISKFSPCAVPPGISQNCFLKLCFIKLFWGCFGVFCFYGGVARFTVRIVYPWQREQLPWKFGSSVVPRWSVRCFFFLFFLRAGTGATFLTLTPRVLVSFGRFLLKVCHASLGCDRGLSGGSGATARQ